jgi:hypothetical protein
MGRGNFAKKASLQMSGNDVKGTNGWKTPRKGERGPASDILGKFCTNPDGVMVSCKRKMAESAKTTRPFPEAGGGGRYMGKRSQAILDFYILHFYIQIFPI